MRTLLLAGAAALAFSTAALAQGQGKGGGQGKAAHSQHQGGGNGAEARGRGQGAARQAVRQEARQEVRQARQVAREERRAERVVRQRPARAEANAQRQAQRSVVRNVRRAERVQIRDARREIRDMRADLPLRSDLRRIRDGRFDNDLRFVGRGRDCPPGLAKQNDFCMPPGQLRRAERLGDRLPLASLGYNVPDLYSYRFADDARYFYRYDDDAIYRFDRGSSLVSGIFPLASTGLMLGEPMPLGYYDVYNVPLAYRSYYPDSDDYLYRYDDDAIYRVNSGNGIVDSIVALLGGGGLGGLGIGDSMPMGYDAYNVPLDYRDDYVDSDDALYRYADGSIYQVDPQTQLIEAIISLIT